MKKAKSRGWRWLIAVAVLSFACAPLSVAGLPTQAPGIVDTIVAQTATAAAVQTASVPPTATSTSTFTPTLSKTPTVTPTLTSTYIYIVTRTATASRTPTSTTSAGGSTSSETYHCQLVSQTPANGSTMKPNTDFDWNWKVKNDGTKKWSASSVDYAYVSGDKFHKQNAYDLPEDVSSGESVQLTVDMKAPKNEGTYITTWGLKVGKTTFCLLSFNIVVDK
jgi:hypothetical protein